MEPLREGSKSRGRGHGEFVDLRLRCEQQPAVGSELRIEHYAHLRSPRPAFDITGYFGTVLTNSYDATDNRTAIADSFGGLTTRTFDALNRMATIQYSGQSQTLREDFAYSARDQVVGETRCSNLAGTAIIGYSTVGYDGVGRLTNLQHLTGSSINIANFTNSYDLASRITSETLNGGPPSTYQYDVTDQLTNDGVGTFGYDLGGNRNTTGYATGPANEILTDGTWNYFYDKNGNLTHKINIASGEVFAFGYDNRNQMVSVTDTTTSGLQMQSTYSYDALQQRIEKAVWTEGTTTTTRFAYDQRQIWADLDGTNALTMRYMRTDNVLELLTRVSAGGTVAWLLQDRLGSVRNVVDGAGAVLATLVYSGFGNAVSGSGAGNSGTYLWVGYRYDAETELYLADGSLRPYDPVTGRWWRVDPIGIASGDLNFFRYCANDPMTCIDPTGMRVYLIGRSVFGGIGYHYSIVVVSDDGKIVVTYDGGGPNYPQDKDLRPIPQRQYKLTLKKLGAEFRDPVTGKYTFNTTPDSLTGEIPKYVYEVQTPKGWGFEDELAALQNAFQYLWQLPYGYTEENSNTYAHVLLVLAKMKMKPVVQQTTGGRRVGKHWRNGRYEYYSEPKCELITEPLDAIGWDYEVLKNQYRFAPTTR